MRPDRATRPASARFGLGHLAGIARWAGAASFVASTSHGVALMLVPALLPLCSAGGPARAIAASGAWTATVAAVALHALVMLGVAAVVTATPAQRSRTGPPALAA